MLITCNVEMMFVCIPMVLVPFITLVPCIPAGGERLEVRSNGCGPTVSAGVHVVHGDCHSRCASLGPAHLITWLHVSRR